MKLDQISSATVRQLWDDELKQPVAQATTFEVAAQVLSEGLHEQFSDTVALARVFVTVPFGELPDANQQFVRDLCVKTNTADQLTNDTLVLSLVGTSGAEPDWNDRNKSQSHVGIPLISSSFVDSIPMIARLLRELGLELSWIDRGDSDVVKRTLGSTTGLFYVADAAVEVDHKQRKIIAAQDFVTQRGIQSVFGMGGAYFGGTIVVVICFCTSKVDRKRVTRLLPLVNLFKAQTSNLTTPGTLFS